MEQPRRQIAPSLSQDEFVWQSAVRGRLVGVLSLGDKLVAGKKKVALPADVAIDAEIDLGTTHGVLGLAARLNVSLPGVDRQAAQLSWTPRTRCPVLPGHTRQHRRHDQPCLSRILGIQLTDCQEVFEVHSRSRCARAGRTSRW